MQPGPWLRPARSCSPYKTRQTCQRDEATGQPRQTNQQTNSGTNQPPNATGGRKSLWRVCVCVCDVGAGGPLQSLITLVSWQQAQPTKPTSIREEQTESTRQEQNQQPQQEAKQKGATNNTPKHTQAAKRAEKAKEPGTRGKTAGGGQQQQDKEGAREGSKDKREEAAQAKAKGACSSSGVLRGVLDHLRVNTSVQEGRAPEQHTQHGVEGKAPHRAEAFVAVRRSADRCQAVTTHHATGMTTGPSQIQPDTQREGPAEH